MDDPVEIRRRIDRLLVRLSRRDDYGELLANGHVVRQVDDAVAWRAAIRAQARADRIEVRTGADGCAVYALVRRPSDDTGDGEYMAALKEMAARAVALRHEPASVVRHRSVVLISCDRCPALGYADAENHVIGGSLLDTAGCPNEEEPRETPLSVVWSRSS